MKTACLLFGTAASLVAASASAQTFDGTIKIGVLNDMSSLYQDTTRPGSVVGVKPTSSAARIRGAGAFRSEGATGACGGTLGVERGTSRTTTTTPRTTTSAAAASQSGRRGSEANGGIRSAFRRAAEP